MTLAWYGYSAPMIFGEIWDVKMIYSIQKLPIKFLKSYNSPFLCPNFSTSTDFLGFMGALYNIVDFHRRNTALICGTHFLHN